MHPSDMARVQQVIYDPQVIARNRQYAPIGIAPLRVVKILDLENLVRISSFRITHPNPQQAVTIHDRICAHLCTAWRHPALRRAIRAIASAIKRQAMIAANNCIALKLTH